MRADIEIEDIHRQAHGRTRIRNINNTRDMSLHRRTRQQEIDLVVVVAFAKVSTITPAVYLKEKEDSPYRLRYSITLKHVCRYAIVASM